MINSFSPQLYTNFGVKAEMRYARKMEQPVTTSEKERILYVITKSNWGGAQKYVFDLATNFAKQNHQVAVACGGAGLLKTNLEEANIETFSISSLARDISFFKEIKAFFSLLNIVRKYKPDILHLNSTKAGLLGVVIGRLCRVPKIIFTAHGWPFLEPRSRHWKILVWLGSYFTALLAHQLIVVSENDYKQTKMPGILKKTTVIHPAIKPFPLFTREEARAKLFTEEVVQAHAHNLWLVTNAELNHNKNQMVVINAVAEYNSNNQTKIFYTLIGEGDDFANLQEQITLKGLGDYVHLLGYIPSASTYLAAFDFFILPSKKEGFPYALLEAGVARIPTLATGVGGIPELIKHKDTGYIVDRDNHQTIVTALEELLANPNLRNMIASNLEETVKIDFALEQMIEKTKRVYQR